MFVFIKKIFYIGSLFLSNLVSTTSLNCILMKNKECKKRPEMSRTNETRHTKWHETCKCKCRLEEVFVIINNDGIMIKVNVI